MSADLLDLIELEETDQAFRRVYDAAGVLYDSPECREGRHYACPGDITWTTAAGMKLSGPCLCRVCDE